MNTDLTPTEINILNEIFRVSVFDPQNMAHFHSHEAIAFFDVLKSLHNKEYIRLPKYLLDKPIEEIVKEDIPFTFEYLDKILPLYEEYKTKHKC